MPPHIVESTKVAGLFRMAMPAALGGLEFDPVTIVESIEAVSHTDASAGWTTLIGNSTAFFAWLEPTAANDMLGGGKRHRVDEHVRADGPSETRRWRRHRRGTLAVQQRVRARGLVAGRGRRHERRPTGPSGRWPT